MLTGSLGGLGDPRILLGHPPPLIEWARALLLLLRVSGRLEELRSGVS